MTVFRRDLEIIPRISRGRPGVLLRDPRTDTVFELRDRDLFICQLLDGLTPPEEIRRRHDEKFEVPLGAAELDAFVTQLGHQGLLEAEEGAVPRRRTLPELLAPEEFIVEWNLPFFLYGGGDRLFAWLARCFRWAFSRPAQWLGWAAIAAGLDILILDWSRFTASTSAHWGPIFFITMIIPASLLLRSLRSVIQGIHSKLNKGNIREIGLTFLYYLLPSLYCDWWSDVVWIRDKKERFWRLGSGLYLQALLWAIATVGWRFSDPEGFPNTLWLAASLAAALNFVLANANPLVQLEGYLILMNWLEIPRLRERANAAFGAWLYRRGDPEPLTRRQRRWFVLYGALSFAYVVLMIGLHFYFTWSWLTDSLEGAGALLTAAIGLYAFQKPLLTWLGGLASVRWLLDPTARRRLWSAAGGTAVAAIALLLLPWPYHAGGPFVLLPESRVQVRVDVPGMVEEVLVREGDWVEAGQPLVRLSVRASDRNLQATEARLAESRAQLDLLISGTKPEEIAKAASAVFTATAKLDWSRARAERLTKMRREDLVSSQDWENALRERDADAQTLAEARAQLDLVRSGARREEIEAAQAQIRSLQAAVDNFRADTERAVIVSPIAGRVTTPRIEELAGAILKPGQRDIVATIEDARTLRAEVQVPETHADDIRLGAEVKLVAWAYHAARFRGRVTAIAPVAESVSSGAAQLSAEGAAAPPAKGIALTRAADRAVRVITEIPNPDGRLRAEMTGQAKIDAGSRPLWDVLLGPFLRFCMVEVWSWIP